MPRITFLIPETDSVLQMWWKTTNHILLFDHLSKNCISIVTTTGHFYLNMVPVGHIIRLCHQWFLSLLMSHMSVRNEVWHIISNQLWISNIFPITAGIHFWPLYGGWRFIFFRSVTPRMTLWISDIDDVPHS